MPTLRVSDHFGIGKPAHFYPDQFKRFFETAHANRNAVTCTHQFDQTGAPFRIVTAGRKRLGDRTEASGDLI